MKEAFLSDHLQAAFILAPMAMALREQGAAAAGVEVPKLAEPHRLSWVNIALIVGSLIGGWALLGVLVSVGNSFDTIVGADWGWVVTVAVLAPWVARSWTVIPSPGVTKAP